MLAWHRKGFHPFWNMARRAWQARSTDVPQKVRDPIRMHSRNNSAGWAHRDFELRKLERFDMHA